MRPDWETLSNETHFENEHLSVTTVEVRTPARPKTRRWTVVKRKRAVVIAPLTVDGMLVLIQQERISVGQTLWEVPAGQIDDLAVVADDAIRDVALRELREETGFELAEGGELLALGDYFTSPGFTDEHGFCFLARPVKLSLRGSSPEESESILDCRAFTPEAIGQMIANNEIRDANTLSICARLIARGLFSFSTR